MADSYGGVLGAFPYAFRTSGSLLFKSYTVVGALAALAWTALFGLALVVLVAQTTTGRGGTLSLARSFFVLLALFLVAPTVAPVLFVARNHRRGEARSERYDVALAASGYLFLVSVYVGLLATVPAEFQRAGAGPVVGWLYSLPPLAGLVPPVVAALLILAVHRLVS
jgi:hypothetical protein